MNSSSFIRYPPIFCAKFSPVTLCKALQFCNVQSKRNYFNLGRSWGLERTQYTKYRISMPVTRNDSYFDDIFLSTPSKEDFISSTKEMPIFLRFLRLQCEVEKCTGKFVAFARQYEQGLVVEKDVYITKQELLDNLWENGYLSTEIGAFELAFPADYRFHYPELAVLFDLSEEECYEFCLRKRSANPNNLIELKYNQPTNLVSSYGLVFLGLWYGLSNTVLSSAYAYSKTYPFLAMYYLLAMRYYRQIRDYFFKEENILVDQAKISKTEAEESICNQLKKYVKDVNCINYLKDFKPHITNDMDTYYSALTYNHAIRMQKTIKDKLQAIYNAEQDIQKSTQKIIMTGVIDYVKEEIVKNKKLQDDVTNYSIQQVIGTELKEKHPVIKLCIQLLNEINSIDMNKLQVPNKSMDQLSFKEKVAKIYQDMEGNFLDNYCVKPSEVQLIKEMGRKCNNNTTKRFELEKLSKEESAKFRSLFESAVNRVGFYFPDINETANITVGAHCTEFTNDINASLDSIKKEIEEKRYFAFVNSFA